MGDRRHIRFQTPTAVNPSWNRAPSHVHPHSRPHPVVRQPIPIPMRTNRAASVTSSVTPPLITITGNLIFTNMPEDGVAVLGPVCLPPSTSPRRNHRSSRPAPPHVIYQRQQRTTQHSLPARVPFSQPSMPSRPQRNRITLNPPHRFFYEQQEQVAVTDEFLWGSNGSHYMYSNVEAARVSMPTPVLPALLPHISRIVPNYTAPLPPYPSTPTPRGRSYVSGFPSRSNESHVDAPRGGVHSYSEEGASYEALLELGEQLGTVKLLSEEDISAHLNVEEASSSMESDMCVICQDTIELEQAIAVLQCKHSYHADCIKRWLLEKNACPVCKRTGIVV